ncbi:MAG: ABA4-like family protein [Sphingomonadaceae bacterium]
MSWNAIFSAVNLLALVAWGILILAPRKPVLLALVLYLGVGLLCLIYAAGLVSILTGLVDPVGPDGPGADFTTIEGVRAIFASDGGVTVGWTHYLAFDLFVGLWIARDADAKGFSRLVQAPILLATFMAGPLGLLIWLMVRERRARAQGRWS